MYIGTYCQYVEEKGCCSCKKQWKPKRLALPPFLSVIAPPLVLLDLAGARSCMVLQWYFLQDLRNHFLQESCVLQGVQDKKFLFLHNPLGYLARPNSNEFVYMSLYTLTWRNRTLPSPTRINLEEPGGSPSPSRINLFLCLSFCPSVSKG